MHAGNCTDDSADYQASGGTVTEIPPELMGQWFTLTPHTFVALTVTSPISFKFRIGSQIIEVLNVQDNEDLSLVECDAQYSVDRLERKVAP